MSYLELGLQYYIGKYYPEIKEEIKNIKDKNNNKYKNIRVLLHDTITTCEFQSGRLNIYLNQMNYITYICEG